MADMRFDASLLGSKWTRWTLLAMALLAFPPLFPQGTLPSSKEARAGASAAHQDCTKSCHRPHQLPQSQVGLRSFSAEALCLSCHQGEPAMPSADRAPKLSTLGVEVSSHLKVRARRRSVAYRRQVETAGGRVLLQDDCSGCHDVHGRDAGMVRPVAFDSRGQLMGSKPASFAQVCFGCHAGPQAAPNSRSEGDLGRRFSPGATSRHSIGASAADRLDLPSLRETAFRGKLDCTSCHDNPDTTSMRGPHASPFPSLLKASYGREKDVVGMAQRSNDLCFTCHSKTSIQANQSFLLHNEHITGFVGLPSRLRKRDGSFPRPATRSSSLFQLGRDPWRTGTAGYLPGFGEPTPCATCHEPHGSLTSPALVEFDRAVVGPSSVGAVEFRRTGPRQGTCTLTCHGYDHVQTRY
ncbi:MAG: hypothetical protein IPQ13_13505 [Holophagaceae bacterium]|nr:hypothetical protein [Holophagaceae bacterium]